MDQGSAAEAALWSALRSLEEHVMLMRRMAQLTRANPTFSADYAKRAAEAERHGETLRQILLTRSIDLPTADDSRADT